MVRRAARTRGQRCPGAARLWCGWRRARLAAAAACNPCTLPLPGVLKPPSVLCCAGQPGVGKTCLVYRYLYNTFGETISVRARLPPRLTPLQRAAPR